MRAFAIIAVVLAVAAAPGCLSKPDRPSGIDARIDFDGAPDAPRFPAFTYRRDAEVGDIDNDGFEDLVRWGNITDDGQQPRVWVFRGGAAGLATMPGYEIDPRLSMTAAWYEVLDVSVDDYDPNFAHPELIVLVAEDRQVPNGNDPVGRDLHVDVWNPVSKPAAPIGRSGTIQHDALGGLARASTPAFVLERSGSTAPEIVFGGLDVGARLTDLTTTDFGLPEPIDFIDDTSGSSVDLVQDAFDTPGIPDENMLAADQGLAWSSDGEGPTYFGLSTPFVEGQRRRAVRSANGSNPLVIAASGEGSLLLQIVRDNPGTGPDVFALSLLTEEPTDFAIGNVGGTGEIDVVTLDNDRLVAYADITLAGPIVTAKSTVIGPSDFIGYNLVVIGNFSDVTNGTEIYVLGDNVAPRCLTLAGDQLTDC